MTEQQPESITERELEEYFQRVQQDRNVMGGAATEAARIVRDIKAHREPEPVYAIGDLFEDAERKQWCRVGGDLPWRHVPTGQHHGEDRPKRPLRKLVPLPSHDELVAVLIESITHDVHGYEGQVQRVLRLLEGGTDE